jgi:cyclohexyl-isocyanide hydratase
MKIAFVIFNGMTALDFVGAYDPIIRLRTMHFLPNLSWDICALTSTVRDNASLCIKPTKVKRSFRGYDIVIVPGGLGARKLAKDKGFILWLKTAERCRIKASACSGALLLGVAGFLKGRRATTHRNAFDELKKYCSKVVDAKVVEDGDVITARGVTSSIDLGLYICRKLAGQRAMTAIKRQIDYLK